MNVLEDQVRTAVQQTRQAMEAAFNDLRLARERLRLVKEEYDAAVATDAAARANLQTLRDKSGGSETAAALAALQREVDQLEKDVRDN
jgi:predicted  nucleic acid-binding Zn-ribbon protein